MVQSNMFFVLLLLPMVFCGENCDQTNCTQWCSNEDTNCPTFNCNQAKEYCTQLCIGSSKPCNTLSCSATSKSCNQQCVDCPTNTKLTCSSERCEQLCEGDSCDMECTKDVKICKQLCSPSSKCKMTCHKSTQCEWSCENAKCSYPALKPPKPIPITSECDQVRCVKKCSDSCKEAKLSCSNITKCDLSCNDGCKMVCDETVDECKMDCIGDTSCDRDCNAKSCLVFNNGKEVVSSSVGTLSYSLANCGLLSSLFILYSL